MASPVTGSDFVLYTQLVGVCEKLTYLMGSMEKVKALVDYMWDEDGEATQALLSLGLPPPGTIFAYWTTTTDWTTAKAEVERLGRTDADVASGTGPLYRICDGTNATPDLRARTIVGASNTSTPTLAAGLTQRAMNAIGGVETHELSIEEIAPHTHAISGTYKAAGSADGDGAVDAGGSGSVIDISTAPLLMSLTVANAGGDEDGATTPHENMPPYWVGYWIIRTSRTS